MNPTPHSWSNVTCDFIEKHAGHPLKELDIKKLAGDASDRQYWRISLNQHSWVLLQADPFPEKGPRNPFININHYLQTLGMLIPKIHGFLPETGIILLQDIGDNSLEKIATTITPRQYGKYYFMAIDALTNMHYEVSAGKQECVAFDRAFDVEQYTSELLQTKTYLFEKHFGEHLSKEESDLLESFFKTLSQELVAQPQVFTHRDYHSRNIFYHEEKIAVLDFQDARLGLCQYDLASLLYDSYVQIPENLKHELIQYYIDKKSSYEKNPVDNNAFLDLLQKAVIQRNLKAMGTFTYQAIEKKRAFYLQFLPSTWRNLKPLLEKMTVQKEAVTLISKLCGEHL